MDCDTNRKRGSQYNHLRINAGAGALAMKGTSGDHSNDNIVDIGQNSKKCDGYLRQLAGTQTPLNNPQLTLM